MDIIFKMLSILKFCMIECLKNMYGFDNSFLLWSVYRKFHSCLPAENDNTSDDDNN